MGATKGIDQSAPAFAGFKYGIEVAQVALESAEELCNVEDPETEPFRSKYKARAALKAAKDGLLALDGGSDDITSAVSRKDLAAMLSLWGSC